MNLVDANILLYTVNTDAPHHDRSRRWLDGALSGADTVAFAWIALLAFVRLVTKVGSGGNLVNDAHMAALSIEHRCGIVSFDADFGRFPGVRWEPPPH